MQLEIVLSEEDCARLWAAKDADGRKDLTANEYAGELLRAILWKKIPNPPNEES